MGQKALQGGLTLELGVDLAVVLQLDPGLTGVVELVQAQIGDAFEHRQEPTFDLTPKLLLLSVVLGCELHPLWTNLSGDDATRRIQAGLRTALAQARPRSVQRLAAHKRPFQFRVRTFDEAAEDAAVRRYCQSYCGGGADTVIQVFRDMRRLLAPQQGQTRETWLQVMLIGDLAWVGVPAELFTQLGLDLKNRSPFRHTYIAELANDWIGYLPNLEGHKLGGYQVWTGLHSYAEPGTGERLVDEAVAMLQEIVAPRPH